MNSVSDSFNTIELEKYYAITPYKEKYISKCKDLDISYRDVEDGFEYRSDTNKYFLTTEEIRELIIKHVDSSIKN